MPMPTIRHEVSEMLADVDEHIGAAERKLATGHGADRVKAAGELAFLKAQKASLEHRLEEIDRRPDASETVYQWTREEAFNLGLRLQDWLARL